VAASEENPVETQCGGSGFSVAFDPLDGSSIIDANFAVGTIVGIWPGNGLVGRTGREQVASLVCQYGPRVTVALALAGPSTASGNTISLELTMLLDRWIVSVPKFEIASKAKTFAPGNLRATSDNPQYRDLVNYWIENKYTLRYSGGLVPDVYHILIKGEGVLSNASSKSAKAKLRLLFEAGPIALIIEGAGGASCLAPIEVEEDVAPVSLLDVVITDLDKRVGVCYGSTDEVERFKGYIFAKKS
jgi:sedoheptulose-bisphosphatase